MSVVSESGVPMTSPSPSSSTSTTTTMASCSSSKKNNGMGCGRPGYITCSICSATKYYSHVQRRFGQFSCEPCSKFMKRFLRDPKKFTCYESGQCLIGRPFGEQEPRGVSVSRCKACWLKICLEKFTIEPTIREVINSHYLPVFNTNGTSTDSPVIKPIVPTSGLYAPGTAILLGQNTNLADLPVIPIPVRKRKTTKSDQHSGMTKCSKVKNTNGGKTAPSCGGKLMLSNGGKTMPSIGGKNGPPMDTNFDTNGILISQHLSHYQTISNTSDLIRSNLSTLSPTSLSSSTSVNSLPGSVNSLPGSANSLSGSVKGGGKGGGRRNGPTSVKYKKCGNKLDPRTGKTKIPTTKSRSTIKAINHDIDDNVFRPISLLPTGGDHFNNNQLIGNQLIGNQLINNQPTTDSPGINTGRRRKKNDQILIVTTNEDQTTLDPVTSFMVYGDHDYGTQSGGDDLSHHLTTDEDDEVEGHFSDHHVHDGQWSSGQWSSGQWSSGQWSSGKKKRNHGSEEEDYEESDHDEDDDCDSDFETDEEFDSGHEGSGQRSRRRRKKDERGGGRKVGGAKRGLNEILNSHNQVNSDQVDILSLDPVTLSKTPVIILARDPSPHNNDQSIKDFDTSSNRIDTSSDKFDGSTNKFDTSSNLARRLDPESPKAATRVEDVSSLDQLTVSGMLTSGSNTDQLSNIGSMVDLTSDFPKTSRGKGGAKGGGAKGGVKKSRKKKTASSDTCPPIVPKVKKSAPLKAGPRKRGVKKNQLTTGPSLPPQLTYLPSKYTNDENDLFEEDENDQHNVNHHSLVNHSLTNHSLANHSSINHSLTTGGRPLWTLSSTASSTSPPDVGGEEDQEDNRDDDMIDDEDYIADDEKYYRELLLDPTLRDYHSRESSLFFDEILNTNSPFL